MRVALISDVHGNVPALEAVLAEIAREGVDRIVCLGDVAVGPQPKEALARVGELGCPVVLGNWDAAFVAGELPPAGDEVAAMVNDVHGWWGEQLDDADRAWLETLVPTLELPELDALCFHGSPRSHDDWVFATTPDEELDAMFAGVPQRSLLAGGHTHVQMLRRRRVSLIVNPGSVGLPFLEWWPDPIRIAPWAEYAIVASDAGRVSIDLRRTSYDVESLLTIARESGMPHADWWIGCWATG